MGRKTVDFSGRKIGRLNVISKVCKDDISDKVHTFWKCVCECGNEITLRSCQLNKNKYPSCGCWTKEEEKKYNTYDLSGEFGIGYTFKNEEFYFDLEDYDKIKDYCWCISKYKNYERVVAKRLDCRNTVKLHRLIMGFPRCHIDHIDRNTKNNRKSNLRRVTARQNAQNKGKQRGIYTSIYVGVFYNKERKKWESRINNLNGKNMYLGRFNNEVDAAIAYNKKAEELGYLTRNIIQ